MNLSYKLMHEPKFSYLLINIRLGLLGHMSIIGLFLLAIAQMFSKMVLQFCIHTSNIYESYRCPAPMLSDVFLILDVLIVMSGFPDGSMCKESACNSGDTRVSGLIPGLRRSPGEGNGKPLQNSCLKNPMDRGA